MSDKVTFREQLKITLFLGGAFKNTRVVRLTDKLPDFLFLPLFPNLTHPNGSWPTIMQPLVTLPNNRLLQPPKQLLQTLKGFEIH